MSVPPYWWSWQDGLAGQIPTHDHPRQPLQVTVELAAISPTMFVPFFGFAKPSIKATAPDTKERTRVPRSYHGNLVLCLVPERIGTSPPMNAAWLFPPTDTQVQTAMGPPGPSPHSKQKHYEDTTKARSQTLTGLPSPYSDDSHLELRGGKHRAAGSSRTSSEAGSGVRTRKSHRPRGCGEGHRMRQVDRSPDKSRRGQTQAGGGAGTGQPAESEP